MARQKAITVGGIYAIRCSVNGKVYVGDAKAVNMRWNNHTSALKRGIHPVRELQKDWDLYGEKAFSVELLQECQDRDERRRIEPGWVARLEAANPAKGYNISITGQGRNKLPKDKILDYVLKVRLPKRLVAVMRQCAEEEGFEDISNWIRGMVQERCEKALGAPEQFKLNF